MFPAAASAGPSRSTYSPARPRSPAASSSATTCSNSAGPPSSASALAAAPTPGRDSPCTPTWRRPSPLPKQSTRRPAATGKAQASPPTSRRPPPTPDTPLTRGPLQTPAAQARDTAYRRALQDVTAAGGSPAAEAQTALAAAQADVD